MDKKKLIDVLSEGPIERHTFNPDCMCWDCEMIRKPEEA
jgi:hypothetical protein